MSYDNVLVSLGEFGRYQKRIYLLLCLPAISCALHKFSGVFLQAKAPHRCDLHSNLINSSFSLTEDELKHLYPWDKRLDEWSSCYKYDINITQEYLTLPFNGSYSLVPCSQWEFDTTNYKSTTIMEWELVCDKAWMKATSDALLMTGVMLGSIIFGDLSDRLGRRPIFFISLVMQVVFGVLVGIAPDVYIYMFARLVVGATTSGVFLVAYVLAMEMVGPKKRMFAGVAVQLFFTMGYELTALFAFFIQDWRKLQIVLTLVPGVAFFSYYWFIPESVRWLLTKGRYDEAKEILLLAAKENKKTIPEQVLNELCSETETDKKTQESITGNKPSLLDLFKYTNLRNKSLIIFFLWFINSGAYYGLSWNTSNLGGNDYLNFLISGAVEVPAYIFLIFTLNVWGRKMILNSSMLMGGLCLMAAVFVPSGYNWLNILLAMMGKLAITASYGTIYIFSAEQFPTVIRNVGIGAASTSARIGGILAPYINMMAEYWTPLPLLIFGVLAFIGGLSSLKLPETLNKKLPDSIADGEQFGKRIKEVPSDKENQLNLESSAKETLTS